MDESLRRRRGASVVLQVNHFKARWLFDGPKLGPTHAEMDESLLHCLYDPRRSRPDPRLMCGEEPIQLGNLYLRCHDYTLEARTHVGPLCASRERPVGYGNGFYSRKVQHEVLAALGGEEGSGGAVKVPDVSAI